jgi:hypothetical protein
MKIGDKILVPNWIAFEKKSEAIAAAVMSEIHEKIIEKMKGIYPNEFDMDDHFWKSEREYEIEDIFTLDFITIAQILSNGTLLWVWKFEKIDNQNHHV